MAEPGVAAPPAAARIPAERTHHGDPVIDDYSWLADQENPETIAFLDAENAYTQAMTADQAPLRSVIFDEIKARTQETDLSVPARKDGWWYYSRTVEGKQYALHCRQPVHPDDSSPPLTGDGGPLDGEEILLDGNELAAGQEFFSLGAFDVSPGGQLLAYSTDFVGSERFTMRVKDLVSGETAADEIPGTFYGSAWSADGSALFYVTTSASAPRPMLTWSYSRRPTSGSGSASG
jgi:oligopeptidase B